MYTQVYIVTWLCALKYTSLTDYVHSCAHSHRGIGTPQVDQSDSRILSDPIGVLQVFDRIISDPTGIREKESRRVPSVVGSDRIL